MEVARDELPAAPPAEPEAEAAGPGEDERELVAALRRGEEAAFLELVDRHHATMVRLAQGYVRTRAVAEEVAQETWLAVLNGIDRFEGRSLLRTWIFRILVNRAKTRGKREARSIPFSSLAGEGEGDDSPSVDPERFAGPGAMWRGHWTEPPSRFDSVPEERLLAGETMGVVRAAIEELPARQREVIVLRDVEGWSSEEVCSLLELSEGNQRVLLHRARSRVRAALEDYVRTTEGVA